MSLSLDPNTKKNFFSPWIFNMCVRVCFFLFRSKIFQFSFLKKQTCKTERKWEEKEKKSEKISHKFSCFKSSRHNGISTKASTKIGLWSIWTMNKTYKTPFAICYLYSSNDESHSFTRSHFNYLSISLFLFRTTMKYSHILCDSSIVCVYTKYFFETFSHCFAVFLFSQN